MNEKDMVVALVGAIVLFLLLAGGIIAFSVMYSRRVRRHQAILRSQEQKQQLELLNATIAAQEEERSRIGADIHDDIGPMLATIKLLLNKFKYLDEDAEVETHVKRLGVQLDDAVARVREVGKNLVPQVLLEFGLLEAVEELCSNINEGQILNASVVSDQDLPPLTRVEELALYRIIQEFCNNTLKYANANHVQIRFIVNSSYLLVELQDDGIGLKKKDLEHSPGLGLKNMHARAKSVGGSLSIDDSFESGTRIILRKNNTT